jgi:hypothetical protein
MCGYSCTTFSQQDVNYVIFELSILALSSRLTACYILAYLLETNELMSMSKEVIGEQSASIANFHLNGVIGSYMF